MAERHDYRIIALISANWFMFFSDLVAGDGGSLFKHPSIFLFSWILYTFRSYFLLNKIRPMKDCKSIHCGRFLPGAAVLLVCGGM
jgi:hypothetical protein